MSLNWWKFTNIAWKFFDFYLIRVLLLYITYWFLLYIFLWICHPTTKNNGFLLLLLRITPFVYIACPPQWRDFRIRVFSAQIDNVSRNEELKKETLARVFFCEFCEICKNTFFTEHLRATASVHIRHHLIFKNTR